MSKISCKVIEDLLPLYNDEVCSEDSKLLIEEHISECRGCSKKLEDIKYEIPVIDDDIYENEKIIDDFKSVSKKYKSKRLKSFLLGIGATILVCIMLFIGYLGLFCWSVVPISTEELQVSDISQLSDGRICYKYKRDYSYPLMNIKLSSDSEGNKYVTHYRSILPIGKNIIDNDYLYWVFDTEKIDDNDADVKNVYIGTPKDRQLMFSEGESLPKASDDAESMLHPKD